MTILQAPTDTQKRLYDAFTHCVTALELPLNKITVTKVTKIAGLSRRTFYTHFLDIYDLYEKLKQHLAQVLAIGTAGFVTKNGITKPAGILKAIHDIDQYEPYIFAVSNLDTEFFFRNRLPTSCSKSYSTTWLIGPTKRVSLVSVKPTITFYLSATA